MSTTMQAKRVPNQKSGLGAQHGVKSEATALFRVKPGHAAELRAASYRFAEYLKTQKARFTEVIKQGNIRIE